jgi:hypothetical protein
MKAQNDDLEEKRRHWEGIHDDEAAQYRVLFENAVLPERKACCILSGLGITAVCLAAAYGFSRLIVILF